MGQWRDIDYDPFSLSTASKPADQPGFGSAFSQGFKRSLPETKSLLYGATAALGGAVGADSVRDWGLDHYQRIHDNEVALLANQNTFQGSVKGDHSLGQWAGDTLGNFAGQGLQSAAAGLAGAVIGGSNPSGPVGATVGGIGGVIAKEAGKKLIQRQVRQLMKEQVAAGASRTIARQAGNDLAKRRLAQIGGGALASTSLNIGQEIGIGYSERAKDAQAAGEALTWQDAVRAIGWGIPAGLVDSAAEVVTAGRLLRGASASPRLPRRLLAGATAGAVTEGATEGIQAVMERAGANQALTGAEAIDDYIENIAAGALGGGAMGGASGLRRNSENQAMRTESSPQRLAPTPTDLPPNAPPVITPATASHSVIPPEAAVRPPNAPLSHHAGNGLVRRLFTTPNDNAERTPLSPVAANTHLARRTLTGELLDSQAALLQERPTLAPPQAPIIEGEFTDLSRVSQRSLVPSTSTPNRPATSDASPSTQASSAAPVSTNTPLSQPTGPLTRALTRLDHAPTLPTAPDSPTPPAAPLALSGPAAPTTPDLPQSAFHTVNSAATTQRLPPTPVPHNTKLLPHLTAPAQPPQPNSPASRQSLALPAPQTQRPPDAQSAALNSATKPAQPTDSAKPQSTTLRQADSQDDRAASADNAVAIATQIPADTPTNIKQTQHAQQRSQQQQPYVPEQPLPERALTTQQMVPRPTSGDVIQTEHAAELENTRHSPDAQAQRQAIQHWQQASSAQRRTRIQQAGLSAHLARAQPFYRLPAQAQQALIQQEKTTAPQTPTKVQPPATPKTSREQIQQIQQQDHATPAAELTAFLQTRTGKRRETAEKSLRAVVQNTADNQYLALHRWIKTMFDTGKLRPEIKESISAGARYRLNGRALGKAAYDYARHLLEHRPTATDERPAPKTKITPQAAPSTDSAQRQHIPPVIDDPIFHSKAFEQWFGSRTLDTLEADYAALPDTDNGRRLDVDLVRELSPAYRADRSLAGQMHQYASVLAKALFARALARPVKAGYTPVVQFLAGGGGSGKSTATKSAVENANADIIMDGTLAKLAAARKNIEAARASGRGVLVNYVYRSPQKSVEGAIGRAISKGRPVPINALAQAHAGAASTIKALAKEYADTPRVQIIAHWNDGNLDEVRTIPVQEIPDVNQDHAEHVFQAAIEEAVQAGTLNDRLRDAFYAGRNQPSHIRGNAPTRSQEATRYAISPSGKPSQTAPPQSQAPSSKRLHILEQSLRKKEAAFKERLDIHFEDSKDTAGQPLAGTVGGRRILKRWDKQNEALKTLDKSIEQSKEAIRREQEKIEHVAAQRIPAPIQKLLDDGTLTQWRKYPNRFFVKGVEKGRIIWDDTERKVLVSHHRQIPNQEQFARFREVYNPLREQIADYNTQQERLLADFDPATTWDSLSKEERDDVVSASKISTIRRSHLHAGQPWKHLTKGEREKLTQSMRARILVQHDRQPSAAQLAVPPVKQTSATAPETKPPTSAPVLQNRNRSSRASIEQMQAIAQRPDYLRTGISRSMDQGAPVVFGHSDTLPANALIGRDETLTDGTGERFSSRYVVIEAADLITSHHADGNPHNDYATPANGKLHAVAGNGRAAGITEGYRRGTAAAYRTELQADAANVGIDAKALTDMQQPVLVRLMRQADLKPDIGDRSNISASAQLSPLEQAANDTRRIDISAVEFDDNGIPTPDSARAFVRAMPESERGPLLNPDGSLTRQGIDRISAAAFHHAYDNAELVRLYAQATDPQARTIISALARAAGTMAQLKNSGEFDIRPAVTEAAIMAVNARRQGRKLAEMVQQKDIGHSEEAYTVAEFFARHIRSGKRLAEGLQYLAKYAHKQQQTAEQSRVQAGLFGTPPTPNRNELLASLRTYETLQSPPQGALFARGRADQATTFTIPSEGISKADAEAALKALAGKPLRNEDTGIEAFINSTQANKLVSNAAVQKSITNGFTREQHYAVAAKIEILWQEAIQIAESSDKNNDPAIRIKRFAAPVILGEQTRYAAITVKSIVQHGQRIYSVEAHAEKTLRGMLDNLNTKDGASITPARSVGSIIEALRDKVNAANNPASPSLSRSQDHTAPASLSKPARQHRDHVQAQVSSLAKHWPNAPEIIIAHDLSDARIPQAVRLENTRQLDQGAAGKVEGFFHQGRVYLLAGELKTDADIRRVLFHEVLGHVGLRGAFGTALDTVLKDIAHARRLDITAKLKHYGLQDTPQNRLIAAEEVLAELAQSKPQLNWVQRALAAIRSWLRQHIPALRNLPLSDSELIRNYITPARQFVERGRTWQKESGKTAFERGKEAGQSDVFRPDTTEAEAYRKTLDKAVKSKASYVPPLELGVAPAVLRALGLSRLPVSITRDVVRKATNGIKHNVDMDVIRQLPELLANPLAVLQSTTQRDSLVVLIDAIEPGQGQIMVALRPDFQAHRLTVHQIASVYGRAAPQYNNMAANGGTLYMRAKQNPATVRVRGLQLPKSGSPSRGSQKKVLSEADIVKFVQQEATPPLFSRSTPQSFIQSINQSSKGPRGPAWAQVKQLFSHLNPKNLRENTRPAWLGALTLRHLAELGKDIGLKQVDHYANLVQQMATLRNSLQERAAQTADTWEKFQRKNKTQADAMANLMFDATLAGVDPDASYTPLSVPEVQYGQQVFAAEDLTASVFKARRRAIAWALQRARGKNRQVLLDQRQQLNARWQQEKARLRAYPALQKRWASLPQTGQSLYRTVRDTYLEQSKQLEQALVARIEALISDGNTRAATIARIRQKFESARLRGPYFPLQRFGRFWIQATDKHGEPAFMLYETVQAWQQARRDLASEGFTIQGAGRKLEEASNLRGASGSFVADLQHLLERHGADPALRDEVYQLYLRTLPDVSLRKHYLHRKGTAGYSGDALRAFSANLFHGSFQIARLQFSHELDNSLHAMKAQTKELSATNAERAAKAAALYGEMGKRHEWVINPRDSKAANALTSLGFAWYLGATPAAALVNLSQTAIVSLPVLAAKFGTMKALKTLTDTMALSLRTQTGDITAHLSTDERAAYQKWHAMGSIDKSQAHNLAGLSETDSHAFNPHARRAMHLISWLFHRAEVVNREATALAAYRLARRSGMDFDQAAHYAHEAVMESHFDYSNANRARWMQSNAAKVLLLFRQYSLNMTWFLWRNLYQSLRGQDAQTKKEARTKLAGVLGMTGLFSGLMGLPLMSVLFAVTDAAASAFGDEDDEPFDSKVAFRNFLADLLGLDVARVLAKGPVDRLTGASVGARVSLDELWLRSPNRELEGHAMAHYLLEQAAGPLFGGMLTNTLRGMQQLHEGHTWRGIETMLPKALKDGMKALRYADEGANTLKGDPVISEVSTHQGLLQLSGFAPARLNERYEGISAAKNFEQKVMDRRSRLINAFLRARQRGDGPAGQRVLDTIRAFNRKQPRLAISPDTLRQSLRTRQRYNATAFGGTALNPRLAQQAQAQARFAGE